MAELQRLLQSINGHNKPPFLHPHLFNLKQEPGAPSTGGPRMAGPFHEPPSNMSNPDSESGYSSFGGDTPSSGKSHSPVTSGSTMSGGNMLLMQQKDIKPDLAQLGLMTMANGHGPQQHHPSHGHGPHASSGGGAMGSFLQAINGMNNEMSHHMNGMHINGHSAPGNVGGGLQNGHPPGGGGGMGPHSNSGSTSSGGAENSHGSYSGHLPPVQDPFQMAPLSQDMVDSLLTSGSALSPPLSQTPTSPHGVPPHTPVMMSPTSTQMSPQMSSPTPPIIPKQEPMAWNERPQCMSQIPVPMEDPMIWVRQVCT